MSATGCGAIGTFTVKHDITRDTKASRFPVAGKQTEMTGRFPTMAGERSR